MLYAIVDQPSKHDKETQTSLKKYSEICLSGADSEGV